jgi:hypothetical protein
LRAPTTPSRRAKLTESYARSDPPQAMFEIMGRKGELTPAQVELRHTTLKDLLPIGRDIGTRRAAPLPLRSSPFPMTDRR